MLVWTTHRNIKMKKSSSKLQGTFSNACLNVALLSFWKGPAVMSAARPCKREYGEKAPSHTSLVSISTLRRCPHHFMLLNTYSCCTYCTNICSIPHSVSCCSSNRPRLNQKTELQMNLPSSAHQAVLLLMVRHACAWAALLARLLQPAFSAHPRPKVSVSLVAAVLLGSGQLHLLLPPMQIWLYLQLPLHLLALGQQPFL